jgi:antitoxin (DNA-binding transcriptional repressor) of toxin-antitoxin stability system
MKGGLERVRPSFLTSVSHANYSDHVQVSLQYAEEHFSALASAVDNGQEVEISRPDKPTLKLIVSRVPSIQQIAPRILGAGTGELRIPSEEEWRAMDKELERAMLDSPLTTSGEI